MVIKELYEVVLIGKEYVFWNKIGMYRGISKIIIIKNIF